MASVQVQQYPPLSSLQRRKSEAEILSYEVAANTSNHVRHLSLVESNDSFGEKFHRSISVDGFPSSAAERTGRGGAPPTQRPPYSPPPLQFPRRVSLSALEESHLSRAMMGGAFESESEKARKARRKSFEKIRKKSSDEFSLRGRERKCIVPQMSNG